MGRITPPGQGGEAGRAKQTVARVQSQVAALRQEVDLLILLSRLGLKEDVRLAQQVKGIDLILSANGEGEPPPLKRVGQTWIACTGTRGEYVGEITFRLRRAKMKLPLHFRRCPRPARPMSLR